MNEEMKIEEVEVESTELKEVFNTYLQNLRKEPRGIIIGAVPTGKIRVEYDENEEWIQYMNGWIETKYLREK